MNKLLMMNLQMFAKADETGGGTPDPETEIETEENEGETQLPTNQSELDALINKANQKAIENAKKGLFTKEQVQQMVQDEISKEKEYADLSEDERKQREFEEQKSEFEKQKAEFEYDKLITDVKADLVERGLPTNFAETLAVKGDKEQSLSAVVEFEKAFKQALAEERKNDYKQNIPGSGGGTGGESKSLGAELGKKNKNRNKSIFKKGE